MKKQLKKLLQLLHLTKLFEYLRFKSKQVKQKKENKNFKIENPTITIPPDFYLYETFDLNYNKYYYGGLDTAKWLIDIIKDYKSLENISVLDWGCGPGRIVRHLPSLLPESSTIYGSDYNAEYINWCKNNITDIQFYTNQLSPPLPFKDKTFDIIYNISIFTHLSEEMHQKWMAELNRVSKPEAVIFTTTHGNNFITKLTPKEQENYNSGQLVTHSYQVEGNRLFAAYQPPEYFKNLIYKHGFKLLKHDPRTVNYGKLKQDIWVFQKH